MGEPGGMGADELRRLVFAALRPASRLALKARLTLPELRALVEVAYYQRARRDGLKMREITELFEIGMTKAAELSRDLKGHYLDPEREHGLGRQILSLLWASPLSAQQLSRELADFEPEQVNEALDALEAEGRVRRVVGRTVRFELVRSLQRLSQIPWMARLDGLNTLMDHALLAIEARFERQDPRARVRNLAFRLTPEGQARLERFYEEELLALIVALDEEASAEEGSFPVRMSILWAPADGEPR